MKFITYSARKTQELARKLAQKYQKGGVLALVGPLGAGKTTFAQGFAQGLGIKDRLTSPTFVVMRQYSIPQNPQGRLFHIDLYRLDNIKHIEELGISEILANPHNVVLIEWAEKLGQPLPSSAVLIEFKPQGETAREIRVQVKE